MKILKQYVRKMIQQIFESKNDELEEEAFGGGKEDLVDGDDPELDEQSVSASVGGVTTPLGTGPHYPNKEPKSKKTKYYGSGWRMMAVDKEYEN